MDSFSVAWPTSQDQLPVHGRIALMKILDGFGSGSISGPKPGDAPKGKIPKIP